MPFALDLINAVAKDLGPSASLLLTEQARDNLGKSAAALTVEDIDQLATCMYKAVYKTLGPAVADRVKNNILALKM